ncbi:MAG: PAS domain S-box protein [Bacteroidetes bacterium]|nr:PAS domain S-box protein [Bacteroidota bacterium]
MKKFIKKIRSFSLNLGLVEQAQIVASTAVIVIMATIITANIILRKEIGFLEFISILTVGIIGFVSVYFSLKYGRQIEEQRVELEALNTIAQVVTKSINLLYIFSNALETIVKLLKTEYGWLYVLEGEKLVIKNSYGAAFGFFAEKMLADTNFLNWSREIRTNNDTADTSGVVFHQQLQSLNITSWVSVPLNVGEKFEGLLLVASSVKEFFPQRKVNLISAFSNHISVAINNAHLFQMLRESEQRYADLFEHSPDMYHLVNREGIIVSCNQTESQMLGYLKSDIIGKPLASFYPEDERKQIKDNLSLAFEKLQELRGHEEQLVKKDGTIIDVSVNTSLVLSDSGEPIFMRCVVRDITEQKRLEQKIMQAQKIDSIGNLAGGIAHDFNNILTSIMGAASIMERRITKRNKVFPFVDIITTAATRGKSLTNQLLTFARRTQIEIRPINIHNVLEETLRIFEPSVNPQITVERIFSLQPAIINGNDSQIQQALLNIFINARDAMPEGGKIIIETIVDAKIENTVTIKISDNGHGMPKSIQQQIFVPFFSTKEQGKGTGLGLSVVYGVVQSHNGTVTFSSEINKGTTFILTFPLNKTAPPNNTSGSTNLVTGGNETILVVDDEYHVRFTAQAMLSELGYKVKVAATGAEALKILKSKTKIHLVILDLMMPEMSGTQVLQKIQKWKRQFKIIISSGYSTEDFETEIFTSAIDGILQKPYKLEELAHKVREILNA